MLPAAVLDSIATAYGLAGARPQARLRNSRENVAFRLASAQGQLVLRLLRARQGLERVHDQHAFMAYLADRGFPVPAPLSTTDGRTVARIDDVAYAVYPLIRGRPFRRGHAPDVAAAAAALARYHCLTADYTGPMVGAEPEFPEQFLEAVRRFTAAAREVAALSSSLRIARKLEHLEATLPGIEDRIRAMTYRDLPRVVIHGDYRRANLLFREHALVAVLDFDRSRLETRVLDVAIAVSNLARGAYRKVFLDLELVRAFMLAYRRVLPLEEAELLALPLLVEARVACAAMERICRLRDAPVLERGKRAHKFRKYAKRLRWLHMSSGRWEEALRVR